ncbi:helix-turn-helix domain-containing protein [Paeniglutamicibacter gangotriensis]|uniref:Transcriptional regulator n=2 Tax=Paeniglutamicibacter gangotriensis TaxID=254787 RepID=M7NA68_9MICC|nr:helix-turn-helix domain-containing protein [Paeniglutamicibacter gangotriensis]EMQ98679.1 transcriptional regulator [Paeniglutamicibacter gangotriensis Lz1y]KAA0976171.1 helix-turn-helix transcriptional regulator [Paeniglutamicibacter gangotriensis]
MATNHVISRNIQRIRMERELSLGELARRAGVSKQTLSKIEQGQGNPTIGTLEEVARALSIRIGGLLTEWGSPVLMRRKADGSWSTKPQGPTRELDQIYGSGYVRTQLLAVEVPLESAKGATLSTGSLHQVYVIEGPADIRYGTEIVRLFEGDFLRFPADVEHAFGALEAKALLHITSTAPHVAQFASKG